MPIGVLKIKLGACLTMPTKRFYPVLDEIASECNRMRNHVQRRWLRWREDEPEWKPAQCRTRDGSLKVSASGKPIMEKGAISQEVRNKLYHYACDLVPSISPAIAGECAAEVVKKLTDRMPWNHEGKSKYRWQALLNDEVSPSTYRGSVIPVHNTKNGITYVADSTGMPGARGEFCGKSSFVLSLGLYSRNSGRKTVKHSIRLECRQLSDGNRNLIRRIIKGEGGCSFRCSKLCKIKDDWYLMLTYQSPEKDHSLDVNRIATLYPLPPGAPRPFLVEFPDGSTRFVGDGRMYEQQHGRLDSRRRAIRIRSGDGTGRGRGKKRMYRNLKSGERTFINLEDRFTHMLVSDVLKECIKNDCGTLVYREPTMPMRDGKTWFRRQPGKWGLIPFCWSVFESGLRFKMTEHSIVMDKKMTRISVAEHKEKFLKWYPKTKESIAV